MVSRQGEGLSKLLGRSQHAGRPALFVFASERDCVQVGGRGALERNVRGEQVSRWREALSGAGLWEMATYASVHPDETALDLFSSLRARPFSAGLRIIDTAVPGGLNAGDVVELTGASGSGKSMLLSTIAARLVTGELHGGPRIDVIYLDMDGRAPQERLVACVEFQLASCEPPSPVGDYLARISLTYCADMLQLGAALVSARFLLAALPSNRLLAILVDGLGGSFWVDKEDVGKQGGHAYDKASTLILELTRSRRALAFVATAILFENNKEVAPMISRQARVRLRAQAASGSGRLGAGGYQIELSRLPIPSTRNGHGGLEAAPAPKRAAVGIGTWPSGKKHAVTRAWSCCSVAM
ncbi:hypothetical protein T492DRAFT_878330 [Pavlovales sp. CCMP2436]|nr:hypothetical protein T492DRAFT_878330 [Pavlovales sp. CCMP2436]